MNHAAYAPEAAGIACNAVTVAQQVQRLIAGNGARGCDTLVLMGENHQQLPQQFWETAFLRATHTLDRDVVFFDELPRETIFTLENAYAPGDFYGLANAAGPQHFTKFAPAAYALTQFIAFRPVDMTADGNRRITHDIPTMFYARQAGNPFFAHLLDCQPDLLAATGQLGYTAKGMTQRNFHMASRIEETLAGRYRLGVMRTGRDHLAGLTEMLTHMDKQVVTIGFSQQTGLYDTPYMPKLEQLARHLPPDIAPRYLAHIDVQLAPMPGGRDPDSRPEQDWRRLLAMQQEAGFEMLRPLPGPGLWQRGLENMRAVLNKSIKFIDI